MRKKINYKKNELLRELIKANPGVPSPDFIRSYKDFLKIKDNLRHYNFHPKVFEALFQIGYTKFFGKERYNKKLLFDNIRAYYKKKPKSYQCPNAVLEKAMQLFKTAVLLDRFEAKICARLLIKDRELPGHFIEWLIENWELSEEIVNSLLRYPVNNDKICGWVNEVYEDERLRTRRSELIGWKINQDHLFKVHTQTIIADIEYYIQDELINYKEFINWLLASHEELTLEDGSRSEELLEISANFIEEQNMSGKALLLDTTVNKDSSIMKQIGDVEAYLKFYGIEQLLKIVKYNYKHHKLFKAKNTQQLNFWEIYPKMLFYHGYEISRKMIWGIYYSKIPKRTKEKIIMQYPAKGSFFYVIKHIAIKMKSTRLLEWLIVESDLVINTHSTLD